MADQDEHKAADSQAGDGTDDGRSWSYAKAIRGALLGTVGAVAVVALALLLIRSTLTCAP